jgi:hypothetical protein
VELVVNGDFSNGTTGWIAAQGAQLANVAGELRVTSGSDLFAQAVQTLPVVAGARYAVSWVARRGTNTPAWLVVRGVNGSPVNNSVLTQTNTGGSIVVTANTTGLILQCQTSNITGNEAFFDNISVREVLEWTNAASFNGTTNSLQLATNPIGANLSQPYTIIVAGVCGALGSARRMCGDLARRTAVTATGLLAVTHGSAAYTSLTGLSQGSPFVFECQWDGSTLTMWLNSAIVFNWPAAAPSGVTPGAFFVGQNGDGTAFFNGQLTGVSVFDRVLTDSERTTIGKAFAKELGVTYLG